MVSGVLFDIIFDGLNPADLHLVGNNGTVS